MTEEKYTVFKAGSLPDNFPTTLECHDSTFKVTLSGENFELKREVAKAENSRLPVGSVFTGDLLVVYRSGLVVLRNQGLAVIGIFCSNGPFKI